MRQYFVVAIDTKDTGTEVQKARAGIMEADLTDRFWPNPKVYAVDPLAAATTFEDAIEEDYRRHAVN